MTLNDFHREMASYRLSAEDEAKSLKDPYVTLERLRTLYKKFDSAEKQMADQVLSEWALSEDEGIRFDALTLIREFEISTAVAALRELVIRLTSSTAPGASYELNKVFRIMAQLEAM